MSDVWLSVAYSVLVFGGCYLLLNFSYHTRYMENIRELMDDISSGVVVPRGVTCTMIINRLMLNYYSAGGRWFFWKRWIFWIRTGYTTRRRLEMDTRVYFGLHPSFKLFMDELEQFRNSRGEAARKILMGEKLKEDYINRSWLHRHLLLPLGFLYGVVVLAPFGVVYGTGGLFWLILLAIIFMTLGLVSSRD